MRNIFLNMEEDYANLPATGNGVHRIPYSRTSALSSPSSPERSPSRYPLNVEENALDHHLHGPPLIITRGWFSGAPRPAPINGETRSNGSDEISLLNARADPPRGWKRKHNVVYVGNHFPDKATPLHEVQKNNCCIDLNILYLQLRHPLAQILLIFKIITPL